MSSNQHSADTLQDLKNIQYALDQSSIIAITDKHGVIEYANDKFVEISKYSREELVGKTHRVINSKFHSKEYIKNLWDTILAGKVWRGELRNKAKDGSYYWVDTTITPLFDQYGNIKQFISIRNDITKRKELEQLKDEFIAIASHELKTPVTSMRLSLQLMQRELSNPKSSDLTKYIQKIDRQLSKLTKLTSDLLDVTKIESRQLQLHPETFSLNELINEVVQEIKLVNQQHVIELNLGTSISVTGDPELLDQVITNLLSNAIKYSPMADKVIVTTKIQHDRVIVCVQDFGIGMKKSDSNQVFEKFFRSNNRQSRTLPGVGLGLYISQEIIKLHHGQIWAESQYGYGSNFCFSLPLLNSDR